MKKTIFLITIVLTLFSSCRKDEKGLSVSDLAGSWKLTAINGSPSPEELDVWIDFKTDGTAAIYQRMGDDIMYRKSGSTWTVSGHLLSGRYSDNSAWASDYNASITGNELTLVSTSASGEETTYMKSPLPTSVTDNVGNRP